jgi:protein-S-isoprenylcysteine O-methyltransferase Ste14
MRREAKLRLPAHKTSTRIFLLIPAAVGIEQALLRRQLRLIGAPLMAAGYVLSKSAGRYRLERAGGPPGMSQGMPERLVTQGVFAHTRNPMYAGYQLFLLGLALATRSPFAIAALSVHAPWFGDRVAQDEQRLLRAFGEDYAAYCRRVPRWLPRPPLGQRRPAQED